MQIPIVRRAAAAAGLAAALAAQAQAPATDCALELEIRNLVPHKGSLKVSAYNDSATFFKTPIGNASREVGADTTMLIKLCDVPAGEVSVVVYQDLNANGKLDRNPLRIPSEPWGASGTPSSFGPPTWDATKVPARGRIVIKL